jgi:hypothetical protein
MGKLFISVLCQSSIFELFAVKAMTIGKVKDLSFNMQYYPFCFSRSDSGLVAVQNYQKKLFKNKYGAYL